jgi:hypothetical protein
VRAFAHSVASSSPPRGRDASCDHPDTRHAARQEASRTTITARRMAILLRVDDPFATVAALDRRKAQRTQGRFIVVSAARHLGG